MTQETKKSKDSAKSKKDTESSIAENKTQAKTEEKKPASAAATQAQKEEKKPVLKDTKAEKKTQARSPSESPESSKTVAKKTEKKLEQNLDSSQVPPAQAQKSAVKKLDEKKLNDAKKTSSGEKETPPPTEKPQKTPEVQLNTLFAFKMGMTHVYNAENKRVSVTVLLYKPCKITQIKEKSKEGYSSIQITCLGGKKKYKSQSVLGHLKKSNYSQGVQFIKEVRQPMPKDISLGHNLSIESLKKGDTVSASGLSKGHGFSGVVKRWGFGGGPASHGAEKHRTTGSIANTATQGRVFPGKKMPGRFGFERITVKNLQVVDVIPSQGAILIRGSVPGARQTLIELRKTSSASKQQ